MKKAILLILFLPLIVFALDTDLKECPRFGLLEDSPCLVISSYIPTGGCLKNATVYIQNTTISYNATWFTYTPFCAFLFNGSEASTYTYNSTIEDGIITLSNEDNMLSIIIVQIALVIYFIVLGSPFKFGFAKFLSWGLAALETLITVWMVYINEIGGSIITLLYINALIVLIIGGTLSVIAIIMLMAKMSTGTGKQLADDGYTKFVFDNK